MVAAESLRPRMLVTGFSVFPGVIENPTELMVGEIARRLPELGHLGVIHAEVFEVAYESVPRRLAEIGRDFAPDIAIHFGASGRASGFMLERVARNHVGDMRPDASGKSFGRRQIRDGDETVPSTLPLTGIFEALKARSLPVAYSDDAGSYLCNFLFYHAQAGMVPGFAPTMSGFVHVPPLPDVVAGHHAPTLFELVEGALCIIEACARTWRETRPEAVA